MNRYCFTLRVRPDRLDEYRARHERVWPEMLMALRDAGWTNYSLFLTDDGLLIGYVESDDLDAARGAMTRTEVNQRWQDGMAQYFAGIEGGHADDNFALVPEIFHLEDQLAALVAVSPEDATHA